MKKQLSFGYIILSLIGFILLWTIVTDAWGYSESFFSFYAGNYVYALISRLVWVFPAILLIIKYNGSLHIKKRALFSRPNFDKPLILVLVVSLTYVVIAMFVSHKGFWFNSEVNLLLEAIKCITIGCVEEIVFRGWGYNALANITSARKATILSTVFFIILHWPARFIQLNRFGTFDYITMLTQSFSVLIWGLAFCWLLKKGKTLWNPIIAHSIYDFACILLVG